MDLDRRTFLARLGLLSAVAGSGLLLPDIAGAAVPATTTQDLIDLLRPVMADLTKDTFSGLVAFVVPGRDAYSTAQGTPRTEPGAIDASTTDFVISLLDGFVPFPAELSRGIASILAGGLADVPIALPPGLPPLPPGTLDALDDAVRIMLSGPDGLPLSQVSALLLNLLATQVNPASTHGAFLSPFARLAAAEKAVTFELLEDPNGAVLTALTSQLPAELRDTVAGLVRFLVGGLLSFPALGAYGEWSVFDPQTRSVTRRPVGWDISGFDPGVLDGWNDFTGYYQGRQEVSR
jgi:hypothetical protein